MLGSEGSYLDISNFKANTGYFDMFVVPPTFYDSSGMKFYDYVLTLDPNTFYGIGEPSVTEESINLPFEFQNIGDNDEVILIIDEDGNIRIEVKKSGGGEHTGASGCCCDKCRGLLQSILDTLRKILDKVSNLDLNFFNFEADFSKNIKETHKEAGTNLFDVLDSLVNLPGKIADAIAGIFSGVVAALDSILTFLDGLIDKLFDLIILLLIPSEGFFEDKFSSLQDDFNTKIPIVGESQDLFDEFVNAAENASDETPELKIKGEMLGVEIEGSVIDLSMFDESIPYIHGIILAIAYVAFIRKVIPKISKMLGGIS